MTTEREEVSFNLSQSKFVFNYKLKKGFIYQKNRNINVNMDERDLKIMFNRISVILKALKNPKTKRNVKTTISRGEVG
jgi:tRNA C32,U32 (ribose-2'-O)-methylase TrmJ